jgi:hypothetical protein
VRTTQRDVGRLAAQTDQFNATLQQYGYRLDASGYQAQSTHDRATAESAAPAGPVVGSGLADRCLGTAANRF